MMSYQGVSQNKYSDILKFMRINEFQEWENIGLQIAKKSRKLSLEYFSFIPKDLDSLYITELQKFLKALRLICKSDIRQTVKFYQNCPEKILSLNPNVRDEVFAMSIAFSNGDAETLIRIFNELIVALSPLSYPDQERISEFADHIGSHSIDAAKAFLKNIALLSSKMQERFQSYWIDQGMMVLKKDVEKGIDYFSITKKCGLTEFNKWMHAVAYEEIEGVFSVFATGLCGKKMCFEKIELQKTPDRFYSIYMTGSQNKILLPPYYAMGRSKEENFQLYKIAVALQSGYIEFDTFNDQFDMIWKSLNRFKMCNLAKDIFFIIEDARIRRKLKSQYRGLCHQLDQSVFIEMGNRNLCCNNLLSELLEILLCLSLDYLNAKKNSPEIENEISSLKKAMDGFYEKSESSWDSFLKTKEIYALLEPVVHKNISSQPRLVPVAENPDLPEIPFPSKLKKPPAEIIDGETETGNDDLLVPIKDVLTKNLKAAKNAQGRPLPDNSGFLSTCEDPGMDTEDSIAEKYSLPMCVKKSEGREGPFYYDEWDYGYGAYRNNWCCAFEIATAPGFIDRYNTITQQYSLLIRKVKKQFQRIKPVVMETVRKVERGDDLDFDEVVQWAVDRKNKKSPSEKIFTRKEKKPKKTAIMLLIDISASTDEQIVLTEKINNKAESVLLKHSSLSDENFQKNKKIIDILRETLVVILEALNELGEQIGVFGFSGQGRHRVDIYPLKEFNEPFNESVKGKICNIQPKQSTRMGCAIRHVSGKLKQIESETRLLILLSDGLPQDLDYGEDRKSKKYAINDTMMAFSEARREGIQPFCITVDNTGNDRLKFVSDPKSYLLINDARSLPAVLPKIIESLLG